MLWIDEKNYIALRNQSRWICLKNDIFASQIDWNKMFFFHVILRCSHRSLYVDKVFEIWNNVSIYVLLRLKHVTNYYYCCLSLVSGASIYRYMRSAQCGEKWILLHSQYSHAKCIKSTTQQYHSNIIHIQINHLIATEFEFCWAYIIHSNWITYTKWHTAKSQPQQNR